MTPQLAHVALDQIQPSKSNEMFRDETELNPESLKELADSIRDKGVLQPILLRPVYKPSAKTQGKTEVLCYELVAGERRYQASKLAGKTDIPAYIRELTDQEAFEMQVTENLERKDIHPLKEAHAYKYLVDKDPKMNTVAELAHRFAKTEHYITTRLKLNDLVPEARKDFSENLMSLGHALLIARLEPDDQKELIRRCTDTYTADKQRVKYYLTVHDLEEYINDDIICNLSSAAFKKDDGTLLPKAGPCTTCPKHSGAGQLFADVREKDRCFDPKCFTAKRTKYMATQIEVLLEKEPDIIFLSANGEAIDPSVAKAIKDSKVKVLVSGKDFDKWSYSGSGKAKISGIYVNGDEIGKRVVVYSNTQKAKTKAGGKADEKEDAKAAIARIKQRQERAVELDAEKIYGKILEALKVHPTQAGTRFDYSSEQIVSVEQIWLRFVLHDRLTWEGKKEVDRVLKLSAKSDDVFIRQLADLTEDDVRFILRKLMLDQYGGNFPKSTQASLIRRIAAAYKDIPIDQYEAEQKEICDRREARAKERIRQLQPKKIAKAKADKPKKKVKAKKSKTAKGLAALLNENES